MSENAAPPVGPNLNEGIALQKLVAGEPFFGHVGDSPVFLLRRGEEVLAFNAVCTHYGAPLADGIFKNETIRCPWHHACFSMADGSVLGGPAFNPLLRREVSVKGDKVFVGDSLKEEGLAARGAPREEPDSVVIVGAGPAGATAAETLRREGYAGPVFLVDPDPDAPYDRPNLSKDYLEGEAPEEWIPLRSQEFFEEHEIQRVRQRVADIDPKGRQVTLEGGQSLSYGALLLATGSSARTLPVDGSELDHVRTLRSLADCREIILRAEEAKHAVVIGASFIGMEVAASLKQRGLDVAVVAPESVPFETVLGEELGSYLLSLHQGKGVTFHLGRTVEEFQQHSVVLDDGSTIPADLVVVGVGVDPDTDLAEAAGLRIDDGVVVDEYLESSQPGVFAAGDIASYPEPRLNRRVRIEHWVVAGRQGRTAARNILGLKEAFEDVPFFWTEHYGRPLAYVGHAPEWDEVEEEGDCQGDGCAVAFKKKGKRIAFATVYRDKESLRVEAEMEED
ncbi:MAG: FAD-dependent oxidoreductase [Gemmatimonadota bacterium]|jgi:3-phenylpropionate/trans-cinnamate dioxygenase ferredoxin reductase subunit